MIVFTCIHCFYTLNATISLAILSNYYYEFINIKYSTDYSFLFIFIFIFMSVFTSIHCFYSFNTSMSAVVLSHLSVLLIIHLYSYSYSWLNLPPTARCFIHTLNWTCRKYAAAAGQTTHTHTETHTHRHTHTPCNYCDAPWRGSTVAVAVATWVLCAFIGYIS